MKAILLALLLGGCTYNLAPLDGLAPVGTYSRSEVDAINAETQCKAAARNLVQIARCEVRREP